MNPDAKDIEQEEEQEFEPWQYEHSVMLATDFIEEVILPSLDEFETGNDENYVNGMATYGLFIELVQRLAEQGYSEQELNDTVREYINTSIGQVLH